MDRRALVLALAVGVVCSSSHGNGSAPSKFPKDAPAGTEYMIVIMRHGQSWWNVDKPVERLTGWYNIGITPFGELQVPVVSRAMMDKGLNFDVGHSSVLNRSALSLDIVAKTMSIPEIKRSWMINERHFGGLCGINKDVLHECWEKTNMTSSSGEPMKVGSLSQWYYAWDGVTPMRVPEYPIPGPGDSKHPSCDWWAGKGVPEGVSPLCKDFLKITCERNEEIQNNTHPMGQQGVEHAEDIWKQIHEFARKEKYPLGDKYPDGEMGKDVANRVMQYIESDVYPELKAGKRVLMMLHSHPVRILMRFFDEPTWSPARLNHTGLERINGYGNSWPMIYFLDKDMQPIPPPGNVYNGAKNLPKYWTFPGGWPAESQPQVIKNTTLGGAPDCMDYGAAYVPPEGYKFSCKKKAGQKPTALLI